MNDSKPDAPRVQEPAGRTFGKVYTEIIRDPTLPYTVKTLYSYFTTWRNVREIRLSRTRIARETGLSVRTVDKALDIGAGLGLWRVTVFPVLGARNEPNRYELLDEAGVYVAGRGPVVPKVPLPRQGAGAAPYASGGTGNAGTPPNPNSDRAQEMHPVGAGAAPETDTPEIDKRDSSASRRHETRRADNYAQALAHHRHRRTAEGREARRRWELNGVTSSWLTRSNPYLGADIENYVDHKWGCESNVRNLITDMVNRVQADGELVPPRKVLNTALREARWIDDESPTKYVDVGLSEFTPVLSMPENEQCWYERDYYLAEDEDRWADPWAPCPLSATGTQVEDVWSR